jgi:Family of unknown function (DUF6159)
MPPVPPFGGSDLAEAPAEGPEDGSPEDVPYGWCPNCAAENAPGSAFCYFCGTALPPRPPETPHDSSPPPLVRRPGSLSTSWELTRNSFGVVRRNPSLIVFPLAGGGGALAAFVLVGLAVYALHPNLYSFPLWALGHLLIVVPATAAAYFLAAIISMYAGAALIGASLMELQGKRPTARDGWRIARDHLRPVVVWALVDATVGVLLEVVARKFGIAGFIASIAGGIAWSVSTYFVLPVLLFESSNLRGYLPRSYRIMRATLGNTLYSNVLLYLVILAGVLASCALIGWGIIVLAVHGSVVEGLALIVGGIVPAAVVLALGATAEGILQASLYRYATTGKLDPELLGPAFAAP